MSKGTKTGSSKRRKRLVVKRWLLERRWLSRLRRDVRKNPVAVAGILVASVLALAIPYWLSLEPDIRFIHSNPMESAVLLDRQLDENLNYVYHVSVRPRVKNLSFKSGFIDKVEIPPIESIAALAHIQSFTINKGASFLERGKGHRSPRSIYISEQS